MNAFKIAGMIISALFFICYAYQIVYVFVPFIFKDRKVNSVKKNKIAVLIAARNEELVVGNLIDSINAQTYDKSLVTTFVIADNCTDKTADVARNAGAVVYERHDTIHVGKGYALDFLLESIRKDYGDESFDAFLVLDADNLLKEDYIEQLNRKLSDGYEICTSYRNSKNYGDNWISAGYALWFLRESEYLNHARALLGTSCAVSGTGFIFTRSVLQKCGGWKFYLLTEDIEFTIHNILSGYKIGYCKDAVLYDEQPVKFSQSWRQRQRWARGYLQVFRCYGANLIRGIFKKRSFSCFDMCMNIMPAMILTVIGLLLNITEIIICGITGGLAPAAIGILQTFLSLYAFVFVLGLITTITEWREIHTTSIKKIVYAFTFPIFMFTYIPICISAFFKHVEWTPIEHSKCITISEMEQKA